MNKSKIAYIYRIYHVPKQIIRHMEKVACICRIMADQFTKKGIKIDKQLLIHAALLHDVLRVCDIRNYHPHIFGKNTPKKDLDTWEMLRKKFKIIGHEKAISKTLISLKEPKLASLTRKHDFWLIDKLKTWEEKILYYADKRVDHDKIVTLQKRFREGRKRNNGPDDNFELIDNIEKKILVLEKKFTKLIGKLNFNC